MQLNDTTRAARLKISHHPHESFILMILVVAVKQRQSRIVGDKIDLDRAESRHVDGVFHHACRRLMPTLVTSKV